jgi:hypothetical protein
MNNKDLFINGFLERIGKEFPQSSNPKENINLAFEIFGIAAVLDKPFQEVFDKIIIKDKNSNRSGSMDGGIDGIWFNDLGDYYEMYVFQCKNSRSLKEKEISDFRNAVNDIFSDGNKVGKTNIRDLQPFIDEYKNLSHSGKVIENKLYFIFNGNSIDHENSSNEHLYKAYHKEEMSFFIYDSNWIYEKISSIAKNHRDKVEFAFHPENSNFSLLDNQALYTFSIGNTRAANFRILATEICELIEKEKSINGSFDLLFEENIRQYLGTSKFKANREMNKTLNSEDAVLFPFLNNGITIITEQITVPKSAQDGKYNLPVVNPQIVNGLQTSRVLYDIYKNNKEKLKGVFVNVRVYESKDPSLIEKITDATNTQTPITNKDKISIKEFNSLTKEVFKNSGIDYVTKRGDGFKSSNVNFHNQVDSETVLKFWYATFYEEPEVAKNSIAKVLQEIYDASTSENHPLKFLFDGSKDSRIYIQLLTSYKIYQFVKNNKKEIIVNGTITYSEKYEHLSYSDELMCYGIYKYIGKNLNDYNIENKFVEAYNDTVEIIETEVQKNKSELLIIEKTFSFNGYFKKPKCRYDFNNAKGIIEEDNLIENLKSIR